MNDPEKLKGFLDRLERLANDLSKARTSSGERWEKLRGRMEQARLALEGLASSAEQSFPDPIVHLVSVVMRYEPASAMIRERKVVRTRGVRPPARYIPDWLAEPLTIEQRQMAGRWLQGLSLEEKGQLVRSLRQFFKRLERETEELESSDE